MNAKLNRVIEDIERIEKKISEWQTQLRQLKQQRKQLEDQEIIKSISTSFFPMTRRTVNYMRIRSLTR